MNLIGIVSVGLLLASCSDTEGGHTENDNREPVITTRLADFDGGGQTIDGENDVEDMQACLFEDGVMTKVYKNLPVSSDGYNLYGAQNETYNDGKDVKWWNALSAKELRV